MRVRTKRPLLTAAHRLHRMEWCTARKQWGVENWESVIFSDEVPFVLFDSSNKKWCFVDPRIGLTEAQFTSIVQKGGGCIICWGCITSEGVGYLCKFNVTIDADVYIKVVINGELESTLEHYSLDRRDVYFQQDGTRPHTAKATKAVLQAKGWDVLEWPANSPDLKTQ